MITIMMPYQEAIKFDYAVQMKVDELYFRWAQFTVHLKILTFVSVEILKYNEAK